MQEDHNKRRAVATGFRDDTTENEVETIPISTISEAGMSKERIQIKCPAKPISHAFLQFTDSEERDKYIRSANMQKKRIQRKQNKNITCWRCRGKISTKKLGYIKFCLSKQHEIPLTKITLNRVKKHVSVEGQIAIRTCENGHLKYHKFQNIEKEVEDYTDDWLSKKIVASTVSSRIMGIRRRSEERTTSSHERKTFTQTSKKNRPMEKAGAHRDSDSLMETFHCA